MLGEREKKVLLAVVQSYIDAPEPVGSRFVTKRFEFGVSPATIRNIMADLEELGFLTQPHTSAGRVPTDRGYRYYVEDLMNEIDTSSRTFSEEIMRHLQKTGSDMDNMLRETTRVISNFSHYLAMASFPRAENSVFHKIEFINYKEDQIAVVLFTNEGLIKHVIIENTLGLKQQDLTRFSSELNSRFSGMTLGQVRSLLVEEMKSQKEIFDALIMNALEVFGPETGSGEGVFISGLKEVVNLPDFSNIEKIKELSRTIEDRHNMINLIDNLISRGGIHVMIGEEIPVENMKCLSLVASTYEESDRSVGIVGIIGPTRMNYHSAIAIVDTAAKFISRILLEK